MREFIKVMFSGMNLGAILFSLSFIGIGTWMALDTMEEGGGIMLAAGVVGIIFVTVTTIVSYKKNG